MWQISGLQLILTDTHGPGHDLTRLYQYNNQRLSDIRLVRTITVRLIIITANNNCLFGTELNYMSGLLIVRETALILMSSTWLGWSL